jgi:hypothetical protein
LAESASSRGNTLWSAVQAFLAEREWSTRSDVLERFKYDDEVSVRSILHDLVESGIAVRSGMRADTRYRAATEEELRDLGTGTRTSNPDEAAGWEAAIVDHHRTVLNAIAHEVTGGVRSSLPSDEGGTTLAFNLWPGHPKELDVRQLLAQTRAVALPLWEEVNASSKEEPHSGAYQIHIYFGQYVVADDDLP